MSAGCGTLGPVSASGTLVQLKRVCSEGVHVRCIRLSLIHLKATKLNPLQKAKIYGFLTNAYLAVGKEEEAREAVAQMVRVFPCASKPPIKISSLMLLLFRQERQRLLKEDQERPQIIHIPPTKKEFLLQQTIQAQVTDNIGIKKVYLYYRFDKKGGYFSIPLLRQKKNLFRAKIKGLYPSKTSIFQYYIRAQDCASRVSQAQLDEREPYFILFRNQTKRGRSFAGALMLSIGAAITISSSFAFFAANEKLEVWKATSDLARSEKIRKEIILLTAVGWGGIGLGILSAGAGVWILSSRRRNRSENSKLSLHPNLSNNGIRYATINVRSNNYAHFSFTTR